MTTFAGATLDGPINETMRLRARVLPRVRSFGIVAQGLSAVGAYQSPFSANLSGQDWEVNAGNALVQLSDLAGVNVIGEGLTASMQRNDWEARAVAARPSTSGSSIRAEGQLYGAGAWRDTDNGEPVDATGTFPLDGAQASVSGPVDMIQQVAQSDAAGSCYLTQWYRYGFARQETEADVCTIEVLNERFAEVGYDVKELLVAFTLTKTLNRRALCARSHAWNLALAMRDRGATRWAVPPVSCDLSRTAIQSSGRKAVRRNRIGASRSITITRVPQFFVSTSRPMNVAC